MRARTEFVRNLEGATDEVLKEMEIELLLDIRDLLLTTNRRLNQLKAK
jgi:hypothetical protein